MKAQVEIDTEEGIAGAQGFRDRLRARGRDGWRIVATHPVREVKHRITGELVELHITVLLERPIPPDAA